MLQLQQEHAFSESTAAGGARAALMPGVYLPGDVVLRVSEFMAVDDLVRIGQINRNWNQVCKTPLLLKGRVVKIRGTFTATTFLKEIRQLRFREVAGLSLPRLKAGKTFFPKLAESFPNLTMRDVSQVKGLNSENIRKMVQLWPKVRQLINTDSFGFMPAECLAWPLQRLDVSENVSFLCRDNIAQLSTFSDLESLNIATGFWSGYRENTPQLDAQVLAWPAACFPQLTSLNIAGQWKLTDTGLRAIALAAPNLTSLVAKTMGEGVTLPGLLKLAELCPKLTHLDLSNCSGPRSIAIGSHRNRTRRMSPTLQLADIDQLRGELPSATVLFS
jgi:hypothetical protein